jgi:hypothetical protein
MIWLDQQYDQQFGRVIWHPDAVPTAAVVPAQPATSSILFLLLPLAALLP